VILSELIADFVGKPGILWNNEIARELATNKLKTFVTDYSLTRSILKDDQVSENSLPLFEGENQTVLALPSDKLRFFFEDHGLEMLSEIDFPEDALNQIKRAISYYEEVPALSVFISQIVRSIQLLKAWDPETDVSYSHPEVPFSIFISLCENNSINSGLRVAESILHETMHLYLTLIEGVVPLVNNDLKSVYYSPWREEERPVRGVLHGIFVFKAVSDFYHLLFPKVNDEIAKKYLLRRQKQISDELLLVKNFYNSPGLTELGKQLAFKLTQ